MDLSPTTVFLTPAPATGDEPADDELAAEGDEGGGAPVSGARRREGNVTVQPKSVILSFKTSGTWVQAVGGLPASTAVAHSTQGSGSCVKKFSRLMSRWILPICKQEHTRDPKTQASQLCTWDLLCVGGCDVPDGFAVNTSKAVENICVATWDP